MQQRSLFLKLLCALDALLKLLESYYGIFKGGSNESGQFLKKIILRARA
jgi:hypothetical protein